jgi:hypothetical protein
MKPPMIQNAMKNTNAIKCNENINAIKCNEMTLRHCKMQLNANAIKCNENTNAIKCHEIPRKETVIF